MDDIGWKLHLNSSSAQVFQMLSTEDGRQTFWAESAKEMDESIHFVFPNGNEYNSQIVESIPSERFVIEYFGGLATFTLVPDESGRTDLFLKHDGVSDGKFHETSAGWVSVLLSLKAAVDHAVDLRNHDPERTWDEGQVDN